ncbi:MAG: hypothetical protein RMJ53_01735 [Chitinophagales bacterium]|nr:hypothetical protein [Chitinophagales bacterium]MDW8272930.1 hypothetical protein [Chitinophagales bacterium]
MKLLICCNSLRQIPLTIELLNRQSEKIHDKFLLGDKQIQILATGFASFQVAYFITDVLAKETYHLVLAVSEAASYREDIPSGSIVNIVRDYPAQQGFFLQDTFRDIYDLGMWSVQDYPHQMGGLVNRTNAYFNIFSPYKKAFGITTGISDAAQVWYRIRKSKYNPHVETINGIYFSFPCLMKKLNFYHLAYVSTMAPLSQEAKDCSLSNLDAELLEIIQKL